MSKSEELKHTDGKFDERKDANKVGSAINDVEANEQYIFSSKEQDWVDEHAHGFFGRIAKFLVSWGVESRGIFPVPPELRVDKQFHKIFFIWFSANFNILSFSAGTVGPSVYGLSLNDSCLIILFFNLLCCIPPAYL